MENEMMNEVIETSMAQETTTQVATASKNYGLKKVAIVGGIMTLGALAWELGVKPIGRKVRSSVKKAKDKRRVKPVNNDNESIDDLEEDYPIK